MALDGCSDSQERQREMDIMGEFTSIRKSSLTVSEKHIISELKSQRPTKKARLRETFHDDNSKPSNTASRGELKTKTTSNARKHHEQLDEPPKIKLTKIQDSESDIDSSESNESDNKSGESIDTRPVGTQKPLFNSSTLSTADSNEFIPTQDLNFESERSENNGLGRFVDRYESSKQDKKTSFSEQDILKGKARLSKKLTGRSSFLPYGLEIRYEELYSLLRSTILDREKHSALIVGPRSSGKTACLNAAISKLRKQVTGRKDEFIVIRISGFTQEAEKVAVRSIAKQLDAEVSRIYNFSLEGLDQGELITKKSINETFANILTLLDKKVLVKGELNDVSIETPIIFVVDEVDIFANFNKQTLLYNLFDLVETSSTPISVLCFSSKITVRDMFEKRVRSRFSQRMIQFQKFELEKFIQVATKLLQFDNPQTEYEIQWNNQVEFLATSRSNLRKLIVYNHLEINNLKELINNFLVPVSQISKSQPFLTDESFLSYYRNLHKTSIKSIVNSLSELELSLLICATRVNTKNYMNLVNLNICYEEYRTQAKETNKERTANVFNKHMANTKFKIWRKDVCKNPWEVLQHSGFLTLPTSTAKTGRLLDFSNGTLETKMWQVEITLDELKSIVDSANILKSWTRL